MIRSRFARVVALAALALVASAGRARADSEAQALFDEGKRLMSAGRIDSACDRFERSQRLEPAGGTLLHLAACREQQGKTATAWEHFNQALSAARAAQRRDREQVAAEHIAALEPKLVRLRVVVSPGVKQIAKLEITRDGKALDPAAWGVAAPVDPGAHAIVASAPGRRAWEKSVEATRAGTTVDVEVPDLAVAPIAAPTEDESDGSTQRALGVAAGGVGLVGVVVGTVFGLRSASARDEADRICGGPAPLDCPQEGVDVADDARAFGNVSTVAFIVGAIGLAGGAVLWFTAPSRRDAAASMMRGELRFSF
ncbi:MAG: hypothetical protein KF819_29055 [Labilithrix sp.]|nr:hypothetical protein [Labilithrix sp.]